MIVWAIAALLLPNATNAGASSPVRSDSASWQVRAAREIHFEAQSTAIDLAAEHDLGLIARAAQIHREYSLSVVGFSRVRGDAKSGLADQRVAAVIRFLESSRDVPPGRVSAGLGSSGDPAIVNVRVLVRLTRP